MATLSDAQLAGLAKFFWKTEEKSVIAVAIAIAESGGRTEAHNAKPPDDSYGLWQINMLGALGPARRKQFGFKSNSDLFNPVNNARAAHAISSGGSNWCPWSVYEASCGRGHNGNYRANLARAKAAWPNATLEGLTKDGKMDLGDWPGSGLVEGAADTVTDAAEGVGDVLTSVPDALGRIADVLGFFVDPANWRTVLFVLLGLVLIVIAAVLVGLDLWSADA